MVAETTNSLNTGSYLTRGDYSLFVNGFTTDLWYGFSSNDVIELGVFDYNQNQIAWGILNQDKSYNTLNYSYLNTLDVPVTYSYSEIKPDFIIYKNDKILVSPPAQLSESFGISSGSYVLSYNFTREMAGTPTSPLVVKEISPSRKELKLVPVGISTPQYDAFCKKNVLMSDISPLYIQYTKNCPYDKIYAQISSLYISEILTIKSLFFINTDGGLIQFFRNLYEDYVVYTNSPTDSDNNIIGDPDKLIRIQGIRTYFSNYIRSNSNNIVEFSTIDSNFELFVKIAIERKFSPLGKRLGSQYIKAKSFIYDFFTKYYYTLITKSLASLYVEKYFSYLRNALNIGNGNLYSIVNHDYLDERIDTTDPLTLIVKLQSEAPSNISIGTNGWISNISLTPYVVNAILINSTYKSVISIGPPNFFAKIPEISVGNFNKSYTAEDLTDDSSVGRDLTVSRKQSELSIDYSDFMNFVVFSSAEIRLKVFKNKMINLSSMETSIQTLNTKNTTFLAASGSTYPYYTEEYDVLQTQMDEIVSGFDGYESHLYRTGNYSYVSGSFTNEIYVDQLEVSASYYDKNNRDSLLNNTPQHILTDENNDEYLVFLSMIGHYFDEIYAYISNLPSEKVIRQDTNESFTRMVIEYMLDSLGWKSDNTFEQSSLISNFLSSAEINGANSMSDEDRIKTIRNRLLLNLPKIYKTKGTETAVRMLLSCYGIPANLLSAREYGGVNYKEETATYTQYEKIYMYQWDTSSRFNFLTTEYVNKVKTIEYKFSIPNADPYAHNEKFIQWGVLYDGVSSTSISGSGILHGGFIRENGKNMGRVFFSIGYKGVENFTIYSDIIPIFDGNVYSVMVRRNDPDPYYQYTVNENDVPTKYDLYVQRNDSGRNIIRSTSSYMSYNIENNSLFDTAGYLNFGGWFYSHNGRGYTGTMDKIMVWLDPITDSNFEDHVNNPNSYAFSGSRDAYKSLVFRSHLDYPKNLRTIPPGNSLGYIDNSSEWLGRYENSSWYYSDLSGSVIDSRLWEETGYTTETANNINYFAVYAPWSGSQTLVYNSEICQYVSESCYPYQFAAIDYPCTYAISKYGPNKFRNEKIKYVSQSTSTRLDDKSRSSITSTRTQQSPDSNLVGFFVDPQEFKNRDILRYFGNYDFMNVIGSPSDAFSSNYLQLQNIRKKFASVSNFASGSNPRFNELILVYKLYFNRSIFESIRNLMPARCNVLTGILIEPTLLERPKYQYKPLVNNLNSGSAFYADITASRYFRSSNTKALQVSETIGFAEFNMDDISLQSNTFDASSLPDNLYLNSDISYINNPTQIYPINYLSLGTTVTDYPDKYQAGHFGQNNTDEIKADLIVDAHPTGSKKFHLMKQWNTYTIQVKSNEWNRTSNPRDNIYITNSVQLYNYVLLSDAWYTSIVYTNLTTNGDILPDPGVHLPKTFKNTVNQTKNNIKSPPIEVGDGSWTAGTSFYKIDNGSYLEIVNGYPRNHYTHKRHLFSPSKTLKIGKYGNNTISESYIRSQQTIYTTIETAGLEDGTIPVQSFNVSNVNLVQSDNVINQ